MASIKTTKEMVAILNDPNTSNVGFSCGPGVVAQIIKNEGVTHACGYTPEEAVKIGVTLIQMAHQAHALMVQVPPKPNGIIKQ